MATSATNPQQTRREFISKTLKMTAGAYVGMSIIDDFVGPKIGSNGMPVHAATMALDTGPRNDHRPPVTDDDFTSEDVRKYPIDVDGSGSNELGRRARGRRGRRGRRN